MKSINLKITRKSENYTIYNLLVVSSLGVKPVINLNYNVYETLMDVTYYSKFREIGKLEGGI